MNRRLILTAAVLLVGGTLAVSAEAADARFVLTGVVFVDGGDGGRAWLQEPTLTQNQVVTLRPGESIGPYRLTSIHEDRVEFQGPTGKLVVPLAGIAPPTTASTPAPTEPQRRMTLQQQQVPSPPEEVTFPPTPAGPKPEPPNAIPRPSLSQSLEGLLGGGSLDALLTGKRK